MSKIIVLSLNGVSKEVTLDDNDYLLYKDKIALNKSKNIYYVRHVNKQYLQKVLLPNDIGRVSFKNENSLDLRRDNLYIVKFRGTAICEKEGCNNLNFNLNICHNHWRQNRPQDSEKYYSTVRGKYKKREHDNRYKNKHESGYGTLRRMAQRTKKNLEIDVEKYKELKVPGCSVCNKQLTGRSSGIYLINKRGHYTLDNIKVLCRSCRAKRNTEEFNYISHCIKRIRGNWNHTPVPILAKELARLPDGKYECSKCRQGFIEKDTQVDHIEPVISVVDGFISIDVYAQRMFCPVENLTILCKPCHKIKTKLEQEQRKTHGSIIKTKDKLKSGIIKKNN